MDSYNVNRKVVTFGDFTNNIESEKEELKKVKRSTVSNTDDQQQHIGNGRYKFNKVTRKMDDLSPEEVQDKLDAIDELEESVNNNSMYPVISDNFDKVRNEMNLLESSLKNARSEELQEYLNEFMNVRIGFDSLYKKFEDFDNKQI